MSKPKQTSPKKASSLPAGPLRSASSLVAGRPRRTPRLLVIDDGDRYIELFHALMRDYRYATRCELPGPCWTCPHREGCELTHAHDWSETEQALTRHQDLDVVLLDVTFDLPASRLLPSDEPIEDRRRTEGLRILKRLRAIRRDLPIVLMTSEASLALEQRAPLDVDEYVTFAGESAFDVRALSLLIERIVAARDEGETDGATEGGYVWGETAAMGQLRRRARALARTSLPVLLLGETGTGKSALAERVLHARSGPFVSVDLSAIPETLMAAELFGSAVGAFSGATNRAGRFEEADGGTLFLDEIGNLPPAAQRMLLLALQDGRITRLGESKSREVDVKLVAATNVDLAGEVAARRFRADLYARLNPAARLEIPPLRERAVDLPRLVSLFCERRFKAGVDRALLRDYQRASGVKGPVEAKVVFGPPPESDGVVFSLPKSSLPLLASHAWPGNVRELELLVGNALLMTLADATSAAEAGRPSASPNHLPIPSRLIRDLLAGSWVATSESELRADGLTLDMALTPRAHLRDVARELETALMRRLFRMHNGDLRAIALAVLEGDPDANERRVRTRFQQLGLSVRELRGEEV